MTEGPPPPVAGRRGNQAVLSLHTCDISAAPHTARAFVRRHCDEWRVGAEVADVVVLLTSELVTNAARYAPPPLQLVVRSAGELVQVEVADSHPEPPRPRRPDLDAVGGRGLWLVEMLSTAWGYDTSPQGKRVWFHRDGAPARVPPITRPQRGPA